MSEFSEKLRQSLARKAKRRILRATPEKVATTFQKVKRWLPPDGLSAVRYDTQSGHFSVEQGEEILQVARQPRLRYQLDGLDHRRKQLMEEYLVSDDLIRPGDVVVDCGANIGEFSISVRNAGATAVAIEPDAVEMAALTKNASVFGGITCLPYALWNEDTELEFFDANDTGDSSLFDSGKSNGSTRVQARKLDSLKAEGLLPTQIRLVKVEAEGAEPEIIHGGREMLRHVDFVTVDMGPERGLRKENTVAEVVNALSALDFELVKFGTERIVGLFRAKRLKSE